MYLANFFSNFLHFEVLDFDDQIVLFCCFFFYAFEIDYLSKLFPKMRKNDIFPIEKKIKIHEFGFFFHFLKT